jgi:hypothetical protein
MCGKEVHIRRHNESTCLNSIPNPNSFPTMPVTYLHLSNSSTERHYTPQSDTTQFNPFALFGLFCSSSTVQLQSALRAIAVDQMVTFTAAFLKKRDRLQSLFILSPASFIHSDRLLPWLLIVRSFASLIACRFSTSLSPRCSNFASPIHNIHAVSHNIYHLFPCHRSFVFTSRRLPMCGKEVHSRRHNESMCLNSIQPCRLHFQRWPSISFIPPTPLPTINTLRTPTPMSSILIFFSSSSLEHHAPQ